MLIVSSEVIETDCFKRHLLAEEWVAKKELKVITNVDHCQECQEF